LEEKNSKKIIEIDEKRLRKKVALIKTDYEEGRLQPTPAGHPQLATPRANHFLLVIIYISVRKFHVNGTSGSYRQIFLVSFSGVNNDNILIT
jgi:hypothetical protein